MSASKDRINRKQQIEAGLDKRTNAAAEAAKKRRKSNITYAIVAAVLVIFFAFIFYYNSALPAKNTTAVTIDEEKYSVAQTDYYYAMSYMNFYNNYSSLISSYGMFFNPRESLADQMYDEETTWRQYFLDAAVDSMTEIQVLNKAAEEAGFVLPEEEQAAYEASIEQIETSWPDLGYSSLAQYLNLNYGKGVTMDMVKEELHRSYVASAYLQSIHDGYTYSDEELADYYAENADDLDVISYAYYTFTDEVVDAEAAETEETAEAEEAEEPAEETEDAEAAEETEAEETETEAEEEPAQEAAPADNPEALAMVEAVNGTDEETFAAYVEENFDGAAITSLSYAGSNLSSVYSEWLLDPARTAGDAAALTDEASGLTYVVMFLDRDTNEYNPVSFRHILITAEDADADGVISEEELAAAETRAQEIYDEWLAGDATEDSFAELANTYSTDTGSNTTGGLYETVAKGQMVESIDSWIFAEDRKPGDTTVVTNEGSYTGAHVVFFVGTDEETYAQELSDSALRSEALSTWLQDLKDACEVTTSHMNMCGKSH